MAVLDSKLTITSSSLTDKGLSEKRPRNEDSFLEMPQCGIYAVADGVGGAQGGDVASQMAMEILSEAFANKPEGANAEEVLRTAIESSNSAIYQMAQDLPKLWNMATTIVALHIADNIATIGHVGDSRLYRVDRTGELFRETEDHSVVADEIRAGRMTEEQAENHPSRNVINKALGAELTVDVDLKTILIEPGTTFLICSDGITRHVTDDEIKNILAAASEPGAVCSYLKTLCYERGAEDNLTAVVVQVSSEGLEKEAIYETALIDEIDEEDTVATRRAQNEEIDSEVKFVEPDTDEPNLADVESKDRPNPDNVFSSTGKFLSLDDSSYEAEDRVGNGSITKIAIAAGILILGVLIGYGLYHFMMVPTPVTQTPQFSEMKSENIALTSFEKLRRTVDSDPSAYLKEIPPAQDAEDFYLVGRANLLIGDYVKARTALIEAQKRLTEIDPSNSRVMATDIAAGLVIANDSEIQKRFKGEIENATNTSSNSLRNTNVNR